MVNVPRRSPRRRPATPPPAQAPPRRARLTRKAQKVRFAVDPEARDAHDAADSCSSSVHVHGPVVNTFHCYHPLQPSFEVPDVQPYRQPSVVQAADLVPDAVAPASATAMIDPASEDNDMAPYPDFKQYNPEGADAVHSEYFGVAEPLRGVQSALGPAAADIYSAVPDTLRQRRVKNFNDEENLILNEVGPWSRAAFARRVLREAAARSDWHGIRFVLDSFPRLTLQDGWLWLEYIKFVLQRGDTLDLSIMDAFRTRGWCHLLHPCCADDYTPDDPIRRDLLPSFCRMNQPIGIFPLPLPFAILAAPLPLPLAAGRWP
ncbi:hypothetical protein AURDEDRAFT_160779 [Auricularia subglabra TFB-10046 SS5]|nr:hypothetical protein AURDEDRAFT_160779 [Auricularia subglabra TFB-10046 SS5]